MLTPKELPIFNKLIQFFYGTPGGGPNPFKINPTERYRTISVNWCGWLHNFIFVLTKTRQDRAWSLVTYVALAFVVRTRVGVYQLAPRISV